jgi:hypothetical protein
MCEGEVVEQDRSGGIGGGAWCFGGNGGWGGVCRGNGELLMNLKKGGK